MTDLKAIQERAEKATPLVYQAIAQSKDRYNVQDGKGYIAAIDVRYEDAWFFAHARKDVLMLLKALAEARGLLLAYVRDSLEWNGSCIEEPRVCTRCHNYRDETPPHQPHCPVPAFEDAVLGGCG